MSAEESLNKAEDLLARLEAARARLEETQDPDEAIEILRSSPSSRRRSRRSCSARSARPRPTAAPPEAGCRSGLRSCARWSRRYLDELALTPELGTLAEPMRHALGGKRVRPVLCLATGERSARGSRAVLPAAAAVELVHSFSLVHDDLPALDDDAERRGAPSVWAAYGEATAILAGDALLAEAFRLALSYPAAEVARELVEATLGMIGGQRLDLEGGDGDSTSCTR